jgi:hypothetical protein
MFKFNIYQADALFLFYYLTDFLFYIGFFFLPIAFLIFLAGVLVYCWGRLTAGSIGSYNTGAVIFL